MTITMSTHWRDGLAVPFATWQAVGDDLRAAMPERIEVVCPDCLDAGRSARRQCKATGGMCKGTGRVWKSI
jgi:hypothetical protein